MKKLLVAQSGGPTAVINASLAGVVDYAYKSGKFSEVIGSVNGIEGVFNENFVDMQKFRDPQNVRLLKQTPSSYLGSCRKKLSDDPEVCEKIFSVFEKHGIDAFVYIGGNDSMDTVDKLSKYAAERGKNVAVAGVSKTIDNDLVMTDHTPGYASAAKYIVNSLRQLYLDTSVYNIKSVIVAEIMGRNAGWLTAAATLANDETISPVDMVCIPEIPFDEEKFIERLSEVLETKNTTIIAVSEGICDKNGEYVLSGLSNRGYEDEFSHATLGGVGKYVEKLITNKLGVKTRTIEFSTLQRCNSEVASLCDVNEAFMQGEYGAELVAGGKSGVMVGIVRKPGTDYISEAVDFPVSEIANAEKKMPAEMLGNDGFSVTDVFRDYALPLIDGQPEIIYKNGLIEFVTRD